MPTDEDPVDARVAALEAQVAALTARLEPERYDRRALLRRGGAVLAGAAGAAVALPAMASAAEGDPVLAGRANDAATQTSLTGGTAEAATLRLRNPSTGGPYAAPSLRLEPGAGGSGLDPARTAAGDLASSGDLLWYGHLPASGGAGVVGAVYTSAFANHLELLDEPRRVLDTRAGGATDENGNPNDRRTRVVAGDFDAAGRLRAGSSLVLDLSGLVVSGVAVFANLTVVGPAGNGFLTAYPTPDGPPRSDGLDRPASSNLNYVRGTPALANFVLVRLGAGGRISIFTTTLAHVLLDLTAVSVSEPFSLVRTAGQARLRGAQ